MRNLTRIVPCLLVAAFLAFPPRIAGAETADASRAASEALIARILPARAKSFVVETIPADEGRDVFEIESRDEKIVLRGNTPVSVASALNWYLKYSCHCQISWGGDNLTLPGRLPVVATKIRHVSPYRQRVYGNYCTFSYTMPWWDWTRWQREIDWMALHGVNMPLAITGQEAVWQATLRQYGMSDDEIRHFLCGPAFFAWQWMTNQQGYDGPLPQSWIDSHLVLGQQILKRERELGMTPILQGFTGFVPDALIAKYPTAHIQAKPVWCAVSLGPAQMDPLDPMFAQFGTTFLREQTRLFGTDHLYAADPFHEGTPPVRGDAYLTAVGKSLYAVTAAYDPQATIVMQAWSLRKPIVDGIPADRLLILDLVGDYWKRYDGYWGRNWVAGIIHNYGGRSFMGGDLDYLAANAAQLRLNPAAGKVTGIGLFPEGSEQNPVVYELEMENAWEDAPIAPTRWLPDYVTARYGANDPDAQAAWQILRATLYHDGYNDQATESPICARPALTITTVSGWGGIKRSYHPRDVWPALDDLLRAAPRLDAQSTYRYDLADLTRQTLADLAIPLHERIADAYRRDDRKALAALSAQFLDLMTDMDALLATRQEFLLGKWLGDARACGKTPAEKDLYEQNARTQITVWGPHGPDAVLFDYSNRQWSGLIDGFYRPRWEKFFTYLQNQPDGPGRFTDDGLRLSSGRPADFANDFYKQLSDGEYHWCQGHEPYPATAKGDTVAIARALYAKWQPVANRLFPEEQRIGTWTPAQMSETETTMDWDLTPQITAPGTYTLRIAYTHGSNALAVSEADLLRDGTVIAQDRHNGWTGIKEYGQRYVLAVPAEAFQSGAGTHYTLRLHLRSVGGTDSRGDILLSHE